MIKSHAADRGTHQASLAQLRELSRLVEVGSVNREDLQGFIRHHTPFATFPRPASKQMETLKTRWVDILEQQFCTIRPPTTFSLTGVDAVADLIMELLAPFYFVTSFAGGSYSLRPAVPDLELCCRRGTFWRPGGFRDLKIITPSQVESWNITNWCWPDCLTEMCERGQFRMADLIDEAGHSVTGHTLSATVREHVYEQLFSHWVHIDDVITNIFDKDDGSEEMEGDPNMPSMQNAVTDALSMVLSAAVEYRINGMEAISQQLWPLLQAILEGNLPVGFIDEGDLVVLCGDVE
jgi:hypothetical protein